MVQHAIAWSISKHYHARLRKTCGYELIITQTHFQMFEYGFQEAFTRNQETTINDIPEHSVLPFGNSPVSFLNSQIIIYCIFSLLKVVNPLPDDKF